MNITKAGSELSGGGWDWKWPTGQWLVDNWETVIFWVGFLSYGVWRFAKGLRRKYAERRDRRQSRKK